VGGGASTGDGRRFSESSKPHAFNTLVVTRLAEALETGEGVMGNEPTSTGEIEGVEGARKMPPSGSTTSARSTNEELNGGATGGKNETTWKCST
jgi:hypothetical protein